MYDLRKKGVLIMDDFILSISVFHLCFAAPPVKVEYENVFSKQNLQ